MLSQWRTAVITPIPKLPKPTQAAISITPVLSRSLKKYIVRTFIYPALQLPYPELCFDDQFAFRPTGSTTAAVIALLHTVQKMLSSDQYVHVFSFDVTKAFDTVRHETLMNKMAQLNIPDNIYNWIKAFFEQHFHCTRYAGGMLDGCSGENQCYSRFWTGPSFIHRHHSRSASDYAREPHFQIC